MNKRLVTFFGFLPILSFAQDDGLLGDWRLISVKDKGTSLIDTSFRKEPGLRLTFLNDTIYNGRLTINSFSGSYLIDKNKIEFRNLGVTEIHADSKKGLRFHDDVMLSNRFYLNKDTLMLESESRILYLIKRD